MDFTHLHLLITHLPIYGSMLGILVLVYGMIKKSTHTRMAAYLVLLIAAMGGLIAFTTGEAAEETVENIAGIDTNMIEEHEAFAKLTLAAIIALAVASIAGLLLTWKYPKSVNGVSAVVLIVSIIAFGMASWTGYLGGQVRHTEVGKEAASYQHE
jgi:uncharacterized membrane protein